MADGSQPDSGLTGLFNSTGAATPWVYLNINRDKCMALGVAVSDVFTTLQVYLGSYYVNNFNNFGRTWQVIAQADARFRAKVGERAEPSGPQQPGPDGAAADADGLALHQRARGRDALQPLRLRGDHRQSRAGHRARAGQSHHATTSPTAT